MTRHWPKEKKRRLEIVACGLTPVLFFGVIGVAAINQAPAAHAEPLDCRVVDDVRACNALLICRTLDGDSSPQGFLDVVAKMKADGVGEADATDQLTYAMNTVCPEYGPALQHALDVIKPNAQAPANGGMWKEAV